jgi:hypothetical protein
MRLTTVPDRPVSQIVAGRLVARRGLPALYWPLVQVVEFELAAQGP